MFKLQDSAIETSNKLKQAYEDEAISQAWFFRCHKAFLNGHENMEDEPHYENVLKVWDAVKSEVISLND